VPHSTQKRAVSELTVEQDGQVNYLPITHGAHGRNTPSGGSWNYDLSFPRGWVRLTAHAG
jgi:hypothetical protein